ncbi:MAG: bifunctional metallophosphatase/5'-nucleotidase [Opitutus sp.]|nr:bifunctional metallophosphatase/5'-nucleotidase [Opitutus sp.]
MFLRLAFASFLLFVATEPAPAAAPAGAEALLVIVGDQHSAYERTAQFVARVDRLRTENSGLPLAILINGDTLEYGNVVARRSTGAIDFAMFTALAQRAPTVLNVGNHEPEFFDLENTIKRIEATGVKVVTNITNRATGQPFGSASTKLRLGTIDAVVVGVATDNLATFQLAVRPSLDLANPVVWARKNFPNLLAAAPVRIVLTHTGVRDDREMLSLVPEETLFAGAHDHLRFVHREGRTVYVHSGSWNEGCTLAWLRHEGVKVTWEIEQVLLSADDTPEPKLVGIIRETQAKYLAPADAAIVGHLPQALSPAEAARFAARAVRVAAKVDAAFIAHTTFGAGLPAGDVRRIAFDACVRFDGTVMTAEVEGAQLRDWLAGSNQSPDTPWAERRGEFLVADGPAAPDPGKRYRVAVSDWVAKNARNYLGTESITFTELPEPKLKAMVTAAMKP